MRLTELFEAPEPSTDKLKQFLQLLHSRAGDKEQTYSWSKLQKVLDKLNLPMSSDHVKRLIQNDSSLSSIAKINDRGDLELVSGGSGAIEPVSDLGTETPDSGGLGDIGSLGGDQGFANSGIPDQTGVAPELQASDTDMPAMTDNPSEVPMMARRALSRRI